MGGRGAYYGRSFVIMPSGHVKGSHKKKASPEKADSEDYSKPLTSEALPKLEGSDKQIEWANNIRQRFVEAYNWSIEHSEKDPYFQKWTTMAPKRIYRLMQEGAISPEDKQAGSTYGDEHTSTTWAKSLQIEKMQMFYWDEHDELTRNMSKYRQNALDEWVEHRPLNAPYDTRVNYADMMKAREHAINKFYDTANKEFTSKIIIMDDDAMDKMTDAQYDKAYKSNMDTYYRFLRKYANKVLRKNTSAGWWIDNFK